MIEHDELQQPLLHLKSVLHVNHPNACNHTDANANANAVITHNVNVTSSSESEASGVVLFKSLTNMDLCIYDDNYNVNDNGVEVEVEITSIMQQQQQHTSDTSYNINTNINNIASNTNGLVDLDLGSFMCIQVSMLLMQGEGCRGGEQQRLVLARYTYPCTPQHHTNHDNVDKYDSESSSLLSSMSDLEVDLLGRYRNMACWATFPDPMHGNDDDANANANDGNNRDYRNSIEDEIQKRKRRQFGSSKSQPVLCVLVNPNLLCLCDCIPKSSVMTYASTSRLQVSPLPVTEIALPFDASSVFPAAVTRGGVILNRSAKPDDQLYWSQQRFGKHDNQLHIHGPPKVERCSLSKANTTTPISMDDTANNDEHIDLVSPFMIDEQEAIPSLFTILDPLQEPVPISIAQSNTVFKKDKSTEVAASALFLDAFERLLFISMDSDDFICVTYHLHRRRHAFWRMQRDRSSATGSSSTFSIDGLSKILSDCPLFSKTSSAADAAIIDFVGGKLDTSRASTIKRNEEILDLDDKIVQPEHAYITMELLWEEKQAPTRKSYCAAREIFSATNINGRSKLFCFLIDEVISNVKGTKSEELSQNNSILRCYSYHDNVISSETFEIPCVSAQPIQTRARSNACDDTDIIVLRYTSSASLELSPRMFLYRAGKCIIECRADIQTFKASQNEPYDRFLKLFRISHAVGDRFDITYDLISKVEGIHLLTGTIRVYIPLVSGSQLSEAALLALESRLQYHSGESDLVFKLRLDCARVASTRLSDMNDSSLDIGWESFAIVIRELFYKYFSLKLDDLPRSSKGSSDFEFLLHSQYHKDFQRIQGCHYILEHDLSDKEGCNFRFDGFVVDRIGRLISVNDVRLLSNWAIVFDTLHLLFEESRLLISRSLWLSPLATLLKSMCLIPGHNDSLIISMTDFKTHYCRVLGWNDQPNASKRADVSINRDDLTEFSAVPCIMSYLTKTVERVVEDPTFELNNGFDVLRKVCRFYDFLREEKGKDNDNRFQAKVSRDIGLVSIMVEEGFRKPADLDCFILGIVIPLREALYFVRDNPPPNWSKEAYVLIGREDLSSMHRDNELPPFSSHPLTRYRCANIENRVQSKRHQNDQAIEDSEMVREDTDMDGIDLLENFSSMIFPNDRRVHEASKLLCSSKPVTLQVDRPPELSDHEFEKRKLSTLVLVCRRTLSLSVGRGMMTAGTFRSLFAETLPIPEICLSGKVAPTNASVVLDSNSCPQDMTMWPEFHNGVAAGLRMSIDGTSNESRQITRSWIKYNKPNPSPSQSGQSRNQQKSGSNISQHSYGGLLFALGLRGHLSKLGKTDIFDCLTTGNVTNIVGILLGMSANKRSSCDLAISKMLCLHVPALLPLSFHQMDTSSVIQVAAISGLGLLYQGSSHRLMTEFLLNEIGKRPTSENNQDRESYKLSCGLALGMVNLVKGGRNSSGLTDLKIEERLYKYVTGGSGEKATRDSNNRFAPHGSHNDMEQNSCIAEQAINTSITAPAAMLALSLMYLKTGDKVVAGVMNIPNTITVLEYIRPDLLLLRVVARSLIMWDEVDPTEDWIESQIPTVIRESYASIGSAPNITSIAGIVSMDIHDDNDGRESSKESNSNEFGERNEIFDESLDKQAVRQIYAHLVAGACFSLGLRFAGSGDPSAASTVLNKLKLFQRMRNGADMASLMRRPERPLLEMCLSCVAVSLAMIMAGTGDLNSLRILRELRWRCESEVRYGDHMALNSAIGLLFLGGGTCTLGREPEDIATLIIAFFPRYPKSTTDNQYHLQALRHLYILAAKRREVEAIDVDTNEPVYVPIQVEFVSTNDTIKCTTPCLIPNKGTVKQISVTSDRYYNVIKQIHEHNNLELGYQYTLYVKKKSGKLSYVQDPHALRSLLTQTGASSASALDLIRSFTEDLRLLGFAQYFCDGRDNLVLNEICLNEASISLLYKRILYDCLTKEKPEAISLHLSLLRLVSLVKDEASSEDAWNLRLALDYCTSFDKVNGYNQKPPLFNHEFIAYVNVLVDDLFEFDWHDVISYLNGSLYVSSDMDFRRFHAYLIWNKIPMPYLSDGSRVRLDHHDSI